MGPPLHARNQTAVKAVGRSQWFSTKESKADRISQKVMGSVFWDANGILLFDYLEKGKTITGKYYYNLLELLNVKICEEAWLEEEKKSSFIMTTHLLTKVCWQWENCRI